DHDSAAPACKGQACALDGSPEAEPVVSGAPAALESRRDVRDGEAGTLLRLPVSVSRLRDRAARAAWAAMDAHYGAQAPALLEHPGAALVPGVAAAVVYRPQCHRVEPVPDDVEVRAAMLDVAHERPLMTDEAESLFQRVGGLSPVGRA